MTPTPDEDVAQQQAQGVEFHVEPASPTSAADIDASDAKAALTAANDSSDRVSFEENHEREKKIFQLEAEKAMLSKKLRNNFMMMGLRQSWSKGLLTCVIGIVFLNFIFMFLVGLGVLTFPDQYVFPTFIGQGILQIVAMGYVVVQFLFNEKSFGLD